MARVILRNYGIDSVVEGENPGLSGPATPIVVSVDDGAAEKALAILEEDRKRKRRPARRSPPRKPRRSQ